MNSKIALVTGAHGFVGRHIARHCAAQGWRVVGIGHGRWDSVREQASWGITHWSDAEVNVASLLLSEVIPDVIYHCAGSGSVSFSLDQPYQDFHRTVSTTLEVLEYMRLHAPRARLIYPSSAAVYGVVQEMPISEGTLPEPLSPYGSHKLMAEDLCREYASHYDLSIAVVRLFSVYGPGLQKQLLWDACKKLTAGQHSFFGTGAEQRDWVHIDDTVDLLMRVAQAASPDCPIINGGAGAGVTVSDILDHLFSVLSPDQQPIFSGTQKEGDPAHYVADIEKARLLGWKPRIGWHQGVEQYAEWFRGAHP